MFNLPYQLHALNVLKKNHLTNTKTHNCRQPEHLNAFETSGLCYYIKKL